jgi:hypothetical protein
MKAKTIRINELRIRAQGLSLSEGKRLGELVAERLAGVARALGQSRTVTDLTIRIKAPEGNRVNRIATTIESHLRRSLR